MRNRHIRPCWNTLLGKPTPRWFDLSATPIWWVSTPRRWPVAIMDGYAIYTSLEVMLHRSDVDPGSREFKILSAICSDLPTASADLKINAQLIVTTHLLLCTPLLVPLTNWQIHSRFNRTSRTSLHATGQLNVYSYIFIVSLHNQRSRSSFLTFPEDTLDPTCSSCGSLTFRAVMAH